jgi:hypothetical protein
MGNRKIMVQYLITYTILRGCNVVHGMVKQLLIMFGKALGELIRVSLATNPTLWTRASRSSITLGSWVAYITIF